MITPIVVWSFAVLLTAAATEITRRWALTRRVLDVPNPRSSHGRPVPRGGGIAIDSVVIVGLLTTAGFGPAWSARQLLTFIAASILVAVVSWIDDVRSLRNVVRFSAHLIASSAVIAAFAVPSAIQIAGRISITSTVAAIVLTIVWFTGLTNAYNFMDGIDGIAGAQGLVGGVAWLLAGHAFGQSTLFWLGLFVSAASLGFLILNWPPAKIFMGDVGSAFLGFTFAFAGLLYARSQGVLSVLMIMPVWPFVFDTAFTFLRRLRRGERVFEAHRSHLYQRLVIAGWSHATVSLLYAFLAACGGAGLLLRLPQSIKTMANASIIAGLGVALWIVVVATEKART